jgi:rubrerythrin
VLGLEISHQPKLVSSEIAALWSQYQNDTAAICINKHMLENLKDQEIKIIFQNAISLSEQHLEKIKEFLTAEDFPVPIGFTENDWIPNTEPLFSDNLCLYYINIMSLHGCHGYSGALTTCTRQDVRQYFTQCISETVDLVNRTKDLMLEKGLYARPPAILPPERADFVKNDQFIAGWLGDVRPLSCIEITDIYFNLKKSILAKAMTLAFSQVIKNKKIRKFLSEAMETKDNHIKTFYEVLNQEHLPAPPTFDAEVTDSTNSPFSEKLIMFHVGFLFTTAMIYYGTGWASSPRKDLSPKYMAAIADDAKIGKEWMDLMIDNQWLEEPPMAEDRQKLNMSKK